MAKGWKSLQRIKETTKELNTLAIAIIIIRVNSECYTSWDDNYGKRKLDTNIHRTKKKEK